MSIRAISISTALICAAGCGGPKLDFAEVEGKVTLNGVPLAGALVRFYPMSDDGRQLPYAMGLTDPKGIYELTHGSNEPGAVVGKSRAVVSWPSRDLLSAARGNKPAAAGPPIPLEYTTAADTPLVVEVKTGSRQTIDLKLED